MTKQLKIAFDTKGVLRHNLRDGEFSVLLEYNAPTAEQPFKMALGQGVELARYIQQDKRLTGAAITQDHRIARTHGIPEVVTEFRKYCEKEIIACVAGKGRNKTQLREQLATLVSAEVSSILAVTGNSLPDHPRETDGSPQAHPAGYLDSTALLALMHDEYPDLFTGAAVNPFKYVCADAHLQGYKMIRKLRSGASFLVAQAGWDMRKYQELQWYMLSRDIDEPVMARLLILRPREISAILAGDSPGLVVSREFAALLQRESAVNEVQSLTAQVERIALQAAGCRLLGYSGIVLAGSADVPAARTVVDRVFAALSQYEDYADWLAAWQDFHSHVELAPYPHNYYIFQHLLERDHPDYDPEKIHHSAETVPPPNRWQQLRCALTEKFDLGNRYGMPLDMAKRVLCGWRPGRDWRLPRTQYLCAAGCPKGLESGACGGSRADGTCEFGHRPCFYHQVLSRAIWRQDLDALETPRDD